MNALPASENFAVVSSPVWLVLRCAPSRTMALAAALHMAGAWVPTWKVSRECKRTGKRVKITEPCIPGFVFVPTAWGSDLPDVPRIPYGFMKQPDYTLTRVPDRQLEGLRRIADKPLIPASRLPRPGVEVRFTSGPFEGLRGKVISCTVRVAMVAIHGIHNPVQMPPSILQETGLKAEPAKRATRLRNRAGVPNLGRGCAGNGGTCRAMDAEIKRPEKQPPEPTIAEMDSLLATHKRKSRVRNRIAASIKEPRGAAQ